MNVISNKMAAKEVSTDSKFLSRAKELRELVKAEAAKEENAENTAEVVIEAFRKAGFYWMLVPSHVGGFDTSVSELAEVVEELASADASTAWSMMANCVATMVASIFCTDEHVERMFSGNRMPIMAATYAPSGKAIGAGADYLCAGRYGFGSGIKHAQWVSSAFVLNENAQPVMMNDGKPRVLGAFIEASKVKILGNWDVVGLKSTGSYDYEVPEQKIPKSWTFNQYWTEPKRASLAATLGTMIGASAGHTAELLGIARRSLHEAAREATLKKRLYAARSISDTPVFQLEFTRYEALFQAARALFYKTLGEAEAKARAQILPSAQDIQRIRQVATWVHQVCRDVVVFAFGSVSSSIRQPSPLGRNLVDAAVGVQHLIINQMTMVEVAPAIIEQWAEESAQSVHKTNG